MQISSLTIPFLKDHVLPFKIEEKHPSLILRVTRAFVSALFLLIAKFKSFFGLESPKDTLRLQNSYLLNGITARNLNAEKRVRELYHREWKEVPIQMEKMKKDYNADWDTSFKPLEHGLFKDIHREDFIYLNDENIAFRYARTEDEKELKNQAYQKLITLIGPKADLLLTLYCQNGWIREIFEEPRRVFPNVNTVQTEDPVDDKQRFLENYSRGYGLVVEKDRYRMIFHSIYEYDFKKQEGIFGCRREYTILKKDLESFDKDLEESTKEVSKVFPNLVVMDIFSPMHFCKPENSDALKEKIICDLHSNTPREIGIIK